MGVPICYKNNNMNIQTNKQQNISPFHSDVVEELEDGECCVLVRDLDSGVYSCVDPDTIHQDVQVLPASRKTSAWEDYWEQREAIKHELIKYVNNRNNDKLTEVLGSKCKAIDINEFVYMDGWTLLHQAVTTKNDETVRILLLHGVKVNSVTQSMKRTALHLAVLQKSQAIITLLLAHGANPNLIDSDFCTPLHYAAELGYLDIMAIFLNNCPALAIWMRNVKKLTVLGCCRDIRLRNMLKDYCATHGIEEEQNQYEGGELRDPLNDKLLLARTRSDVIDKILNQSNKSYSCNYENSKKQSEFVSILKKQPMYPALGTKINRQKLQKMQAFAKRSLESFKESSQLVLVESMQNYQLIRQLGSGTFGTVFLIRKKKSSKLFALKRLSKKLINENKMKKYAYAEREILKNIKHPFILHASSFFQDPAYLYMVMDFCAGGDLEKQVRKAKFDEEKARKYCCQIVLALEELHRRNYLFRDLKVANVLLDQFGHAKLADFGLAKQTEMSHSFLGSVCYLAPEMLVETDNKPHTACIDWYLLGVFVYEMLVGLPPFFNQNRMTMFDQIKKQKPRIPSSLSQECKDFLIKTLAKKPHQRLGYRGAEQIKKHSWFKQIDWNSVLKKQLAMQAPQINQKELRTKQYIEQEQSPEQGGNEGNSYRGWDYFEGDKN